MPEFARGPDRPSPPAGAPRVAMLAPQGAQVSRLRRAVFAFLVTLVGLAAMVGFGVFKTPVDKDIITQVVKSVADLSIFVGIGYIGGSVVDYSGMFGALGARIGLKIPFHKDADCADGEPGEGN